MVFSGKPRDILSDDASLTGKYLSGREYNSHSCETEKGGEKEAGHSRRQSEQFEEH